jgi:hypothetical protein
VAVIASSAAVFAAVTDATSYSSEFVSTQWSTSLTLLLLCCCYAIITSVLTTAVTAQLERCRTTVFYTGKGDTANAEFRNLATVLGYEHKLDASRRGFAGLSSHHRSKHSTTGGSGEQQQQQEFVRDEVDGIDDEDEQARRLIAAEESQSPITPVNFQVRTYYILWRQ